MHDVATSAIPNTNEHSLSLSLQNMDSLYDK